MGKLKFRCCLRKGSGYMGCVFVLGILLTTVRHSDDSKPHLSNLSEGGSLSLVKISFQKARSREIKLRYIIIATSYVAWKAPCPFPYDVKIDGAKEGYHKPIYSSIHVYCVGFGSTVCLTLGSPEELLPVSLLLHFRPSCMLETAPTFLRKQTNKQTFPFQDD